ncbi:MAG TPA: uridine kinase [Chroococcales cyanobacterium]|jgi:uridine kinase
MNKPLIIGVAGGSGSGKTTVAKKLLEEAGINQVSHLCHDHYYHDHSELSLEERAKVNYDHPDSLDNNLFIEHIKKLQRWESVDYPLYDFKNHCRMDNTVTIQPCRVVLVEGILIFANPGIRKLLGIKVFVDTDQDIRFIRRLKRDMVERGRSPESIIDQYLATVRPMHMEFVETSKKFADVVIPEGGMNQVAIDLLNAKINSVLKKVTGRLELPGN